MKWPACSKQRCRERLGQLRIDSLGGCNPGLAFFIYLGEEGRGRGNYSFLFHFFFAGKFFFSTWSGLKYSPLVVWAITFAACNWDKMESTCLEIQNSPTGLAPEYCLNSATIWSRERVVQRVGTALNAILSRERISMIFCFCFFFNEFFFGGGLERGRGRRERKRKKKRNLHRKRRRRKTQQQ